MNVDTKIAECYQQLFDLLYNHGIILLDSELDEVIKTSQKVVEKINEHNK